ncbi:MAG TPA: hypothetical protein VGG06_15215 [Thermoanaerobaculia bacterium]|jgi:hypothetical protein
MASVPSIDRQKASTVFRSVEQSHVQDVLPVVEDRLREVLTGEESLPDVRLLATLLGRVQVGGTRRLTVADNAHEQELANDNEPRQRRDVAGERVHRKLVEVRRIADGLFGPERSGEVLGTGGPAAPVTEGERLWRQAEDTANRLEAPGFTALVTTTSSVQLDPAQLAAELRSENRVSRGSRRRRAGTAQGGGEPAGQGSPPRRVAAHRRGLRPHLRGLLPPGRSRRPAREVPPGAAPPRAACRVGLRRLAAGARSPDAGR